MTTKDTPAPRQPFQRWAAVLLEVNAKLSQTARRKPSSSQPTKPKTASKRRAA